MKRTNPDIGHLNKALANEASIPPGLADSRFVPLEDARKLQAGSRHYRAYVGDPNSYDSVGAAQFAIMVSLGLRENHRLLDIGCGSLCGGRLFISYLLPGRYHAIEPEEWLVEDGIKFEVTEELRRLKRPSFRFADDFSLTKFDVAFDFMIAQSVLTHVSKGQLDRCLAEAKLALKPSGLFAASFYWDGHTTYEDDAWKYPDFSSYPILFVSERASQHGLKAHPLIWTTTYGHYWIVFTHSEDAARFSWLNYASEANRMLRILELAKELSDLRNKYEKLRKDLTHTELAPSKSKSDSVKGRSSKRPKRI